MATGSQACDKGMSAPDLADMMWELDEDGDGEISYKEFEKW